MVGIYKIYNEENNQDVLITENMILKVIKATKGRNEPLRRDFIEVWEELHQMRFKEDYLKGI